MVWPSHIPAVGNGKTQLIQPLWSSALNATHVSLKYQWGLFSWGTKAGMDKSKFYPICKCICTGECETGLGWISPFVFVLIHMPYLPLNPRKSSLLACQPLLPDTLLDIPAEYILLSSWEGTSAALQLEAMCRYAWLLVNQSYFKRAFNFIFGCISWKVKGRCRENEKHVKGGVAFCCIKRSSMPFLLCKTHQKEGGINKRIFFSAWAGTQHCK